MLDSGDCLLGTIGRQVQERAGIEDSYGTHDETKADLERTGSLPEQPRVEECSSLSP